MALSSISDISMISTQEVVVSKKIKIKFGTKRMEAKADTKSCGFGSNGSHVEEWENCSLLNAQSTHGTYTQQKPVARSTGKVFAANHVKAECSTSGANKRGPSGLLEDSNNKRQRMDRNMTQQCSRILKKLMTHPAGWVFNVPVDPVALDIPDYFSVISEPMDLGTIQSKLEKKLYYGPREFISDVRQTFSNAMLYNPPLNNVHAMAKELNNLFSASCKSLEEKSIPESLGGKAGNVLNDRATKTNVTKLNCQKTPSLLNSSVPKKSIPLEDKSDVRAVQVKLAKKPETCVIKLVKKNLQKGPYSGNRHAAVTVGSDLLVNSASFRCGLCGGVPCQCNLDNGTTRESSSDLSSERSLSQDGCRALKMTHREEIHQPGGTASLSQSNKSDPSSDGAVSPVDNENMGPSSHHSDPADTSEDWRSLTIDIQLSPKRALRAALLKSRFADTILKAQHKTLLDHGDKTDPEKLQREKERLEKKQQEESARIKAEIAAAEAGSRMKAEAESRIQREKEREAARIAVQKIGKTVEIDENLPSLKDLELLSGFSPDSEGEMSCISFLSPRVGNPLERLGLFIKDEYSGDKMDDYEDMILNGGGDDGEEGEIIS